MAFTYKAIATVTVGSGGASNIEFTSIPGTYTDLCVLSSFRDNSNATWHNVRAEFNGSTTSYSNNILYNANGGVATDKTSVTTYVWGNYACGSVATSSTFSNNLFYIPNYASSNYKSASLDVVCENNGIGVFQLLGASLWSNTAAITSIKFTPQDSATFSQYTTATLYGIKNS